MGGLCGGKFQFFFLLLQLNRLKRLQKFWISIVIFQKKTSCLCIDTCTEYLHVQRGTASFLFYGYTAASFLFSVALCFLFCFLINSMEYCFLFCFLYPMIFFCTALYFLLYCSLFSFGEQLTSLCFLNYVFCLSNYVFCSLFV